MRIVCVMGVLLAQSLGASVPAVFEPNAGQAAPGVLFVCRLPSGTFLVENDGFTVQRPEGTPIRFRFEGSRTPAAAVIADPAPGRTIYIMAGRPQLTVFHYHRVMLRGLYPGADLVFHIRGGAVEYDWILAPGADPAVIRMRAEGAAPRLNARGGLTVADLELLRPVLYQDAPEGRRSVAGGFALRADGAVGFDAGSHDPRLPLTIDPVLVLGTYLGSRPAGSLAVDVSGNSYLAGVAPDVGAGRFATVSKVNPAGALVFTALYGPVGFARVAVAADAEGHAYLAGWTERDLPLTDPWSREGPGFVVKLDASGQPLYATRVPGRIHAVAATGAGEALVAGETAPGPSIVATPGVVGPVRRGGVDGFVLKLYARGTLAWATLLGGGDRDSVERLAVGPDGDLFADGFTTSFDFPVTAGVAQPVFVPPFRRFAVRLRPDARQWVYSTFWDGPDSAGGAPAVDAAGRMFLDDYRHPAVSWLSPDGGRITNFPGPVYPSQAAAAAGGGWFVLGRPAGPVFLTGGAVLGTVPELSVVRIGLDGQVRYASPVPQAGLAVDGSGLLHLAGSGWAGPPLPLTPGAIPPGADAHTEAFLLRLDTRRLGSRNLHLEPSSWVSRRRIRPGQPAVAVGVMRVASLDGSPLNVRFRAEPWISVTADRSVTPARVEVRAAAGDLEPGLHRGTLLIDSPEVEDSVVPFHVELEVLEPPNLIVEAAPVEWTWGLGSVPEPARIRAASSDPEIRPQVYGLAPWIRVTQESAEVFNVALGVPPGAAGVYESAVVVELPYAPESPVRVPVRLTTLIASGVTASPDSVMLSFTKGAPLPAPVTVRLTSGEPNLRLGIWPSLGLRAEPAECVVPCTVLVSVDPEVAESLSGGVHHGFLGVDRLTEPSGSVLAIPAALTVNTSAAFGINLPPGDAIFQAFRNRDYAPEFLPAIVDGPGLTFSLSTDVAWLTVGGGPGPFTAPHRFEIRLRNDPQLPLGTHTGHVIARSSSGEIRTVRVTLHLLAREMIGRSSVEIPHILGTPPPAPVEIPVLLNDGGQAAFSASADAPWLRTDALGPTPGRVRLVAAVEGLPEGTYDTAVRIVAATAENSPYVVAVRLRVVPPARPEIRIDAVANGASFLPGEIAPGQILAIQGDRMGPAQLVPLELDATGRLSTSLAGVRVLFDGVPAPLLYAWERQIGAIVPYALAERTRTELVIERDGVRTEPLVLSVAPAAPGLFTQDASGLGSVSAQNALPGGRVELNTASTPASRGGIVVLYATGEGLTEPAAIDGALAGDPLPRPVLPVSVRVGEAEAGILYAGAAPGQVAGLLQINIRVPLSAPAGDAIPVVLRVGSFRSQHGATLAIR
ncbi:MAG: hypothetical protein IPM24_07345 [Bryobacterales bacterium]|nr:hypothetical protein [Bryobacterales bacterium]